MFAKLCNLDPIPLHPIAHSHSQNTEEILTFFNKIDYNCDGNIDWVRMKELFL